MWTMGLALSNPTRTGGGGVDPYFSYVTSLLHFNGVDGGTSFPDQKGITWTNNGTILTKADIVKYGSAAGKFQSGYSLSAPVGTGGSATFDFSGDFTMEGWFYLEQNPATFPFLVTADGSASLHTGHFVSFDSSGRLRLGLAYASSSLTLLDLSGTNTVSQSAWHHFEVGKNGSDIYLFLDGNLEATATGVASIASPQNRQCYLGRYYDGSYGFIGRMDDFRFTKGVCRHTANFTPPSSELPDS